MKTIELQVFQIKELSKEAQERAHENYLSDKNEYFWMDEYLDSLKKGIEHFGFSLDNYSIDWECPARTYIKISGPSEEVEELSGVRLFKYLQNNHMKTFCKYSKKYVSVLAGDCPFTGYCGDEDFLSPVRGFMRKPNGTTFKELVLECSDSLFSAASKDCEYQNSFEYFIEHAEANEYEFLIDGTQY